MSSCSKVQHMSIETSFVTGCYLTAQLSMHACRQGNISPSNYMFNLLSTSHDRTYISTPSSSLAHISRLHCSSTNSNRQQTTPCNNLQLVR